MNILLKVVSTFICTSALAPNTYAQKFQPTISLMGTYSHTNNYTHINDGIFDIENRKGNFGIEVTNKFYVVDEYFVKTGVRFHQYQKSIHGLNQLSGIFDYPPPFTWSYKYAAFNVPIHLGGNFTTSKGRSGDIYFGITPGILTTTESINRVYYAGAREATNTDVVEAYMFNEKKLPNYFFLLADAGINYSPIKKIPNFSIGLMCSFQLNKSQKTEHIANTVVVAKEYDFFYNLFNENRVINGSIVFSYKLGKLKRS